MKNLGQCGIASEFCLEFFKQESKINTVNLPRVNVDIVLYVSLQISYENMSMIYTTHNTPQAVLNDILYAVTPHLRHHLNYEDLEI